MLWPKQKRNLLKELLGKNERKNWTLITEKRNRGSAGMLVVKFLTQSLSDTPVRIRELQPLNILVVFFRLKLNKIERSVGLSQLGFPTLTPQSQMVEHSVPSGMPQSETGERILDMAKSGSALHSCHVVDEHSTMLQTSHCVHATV